MAYIRGQIKKLYRGINSEEVIKLVKVNKVVYLAGSKGDWRKKFEEAFPDVDFINPFSKSKQNCIASFVLEDLKYVKEADLLIIYIGYPVYTGACLEAGFAYALGIPIITIWALERGRIEPFLIGVAAKVFADVDSAIERLKGSSLMNE